MPSGAVQISRMLSQEKPRYEIWQPTEWRPKRAGQIPSTFLEDTLRMAERYEVLDAVIGAHAARTDATERKISWA